MRGKLRSFHPMAPRLSGSFDGPVGPTDRQDPSCSDKLSWNSRRHLSWPLCAEPEPESSDRPERLGSSARGRSVRKVRPASELGGRPGLPWTILASLASAEQDVPGGAAFSGGLNFPPEAEFPIIDFVWDGKFLTDFFLRLHTHWGTMTWARTSGVRRFRVLRLLYRNLDTPTLFQLSFFSLLCVLARIL